jgi:hypothetical protein
MVSIGSAVSAALLVVVLEEDEEELGPADCGTLRWRRSGLRLSWPFSFRDMSCRVVGGVGVGVRVEAVGSVGTWLKVGELKVTSVCVLRGQ